MRDIAEIQTKPYPNVQYFPREESIQAGCLIVARNAVESVHLYVWIPEDYPLTGPVVLDSNNGDEPEDVLDAMCYGSRGGQQNWTPAYTLKSMAIDVLQWYSIDLDTSYWAANEPDHVECAYCGVGLRQLAPYQAPSLESAAAASGSNSQQEMEQQTFISKLPDELQARICHHLEDEDVIKLAEAWATKMGDAKGIIRQFNVLRDRELQCLVLKKSLNEAQLGLGIRAVGRPIRGAGTMHTLEFEFE